MNRSIAAMLTVTLFTVAAWSAGAYHAAVTFHPAAKAAASAFTPSRAPGGAPASLIPIPLPDDPDHTGRDLLGNDVSDAIATYKRDAAGSVYEEHSPNTEVPHLKPPTT